MADAPAKQDTEHVKAAPPPAAVASDPEEDDLSDLDDVLDEFANTKLDSKAPGPAKSATPPPAPAPAPAASGPGRPDDVSPAELLLQDEDEFAKKLQEEMAQLLGQGDFQKQFEEIMKEMNTELGGDQIAPTATEAAAAATSSLKDGTAAKATTGSEPSKADKNFQDTIRKTMERMQESGDAASSAAASSANQDDILAQMLKEMESGGFGGEGNDEDFSKILMGMMEQLTNKEILYEPMKELDDKFPAWMEKNKDKVPKDDLKRYEEQQVLVKEITARFERKGYSDDNSKDREYIVERMQKMQAAGSPPPDLVGDMNAAQEALAGMDEGCPTQ